MTKEKRNLIIAAQAIYACVFWLMFMWVTDGKIIEPHDKFFSCFLYGTIGVIIWGATTGNIEW